MSLADRVNKQKDQLYAKLLRQIKNNTGKREIRVLRNRYPSYSYSCSYGDFLVNPNSSSDGNRSSPIYNT